MQGIVSLNLAQFSIVYILLLVVLAVMKKCRVNQSKQLIIASMRMTVQLVIAGLILTYIFKNPHPLFTILYLALMTTFAIHRVISKNSAFINKRFRLAIGISIGLSGTAIIAFFIIAVVGESIFNPQYAIPLSGMILGNSMTGVSLGVKNFSESLENQRAQIETLLNIGAHPKKILLPFVNQSFETAMLPTMNSMLGMGIVSLPGMMTGQILSGTSPSTAILYQISIMIAICTVVCLSVFGSLYLGYQTLYNSKNQINL